MSTVLGGAMIAALAILPATGGPASASTSSTSTDAAGPAAVTRIGRVPVRPCAKTGRALCGSIRVPLDYSSAAGPLIKIAFRWLPASGTGRAAGTVLAVEGGPGFSSTGSGPLYRAMAGPLLRTRNLLLVNLRGTGNSTPVEMQ